jgi:predicted DNA-binding transcriptional regulator AlpA
MTEKIVSAKEFGQLTGLSESTQRRMRTRGELNFLRLGRRRVAYLESHLREFLEACALKARLEK